MLINRLGGVLSQYILVSNHHDVHFKYLTVLYANYTSIKMNLRKKNIYNDQLEFLKSKHFCFLKRHYKGKRKEMSQDVVTVGRII